MNFISQKQRLNPKCLPYSVSEAVPIEKKTDLALAIVPQPGSLDEDRLQLAFQKHGTLSQMNDAYTRKVPLVCGIEVKTPSGDVAEANAQLGIWYAAGLSRLKQMTNLPP